MGLLSRPPDPALVGFMERNVAREIRIEPFLPIEWLRHQRRDDYWKHGSVCEDYSKIKAATLAIGGWGDAIKILCRILLRTYLAQLKE